MQHNDTPRTDQAANWQAMSDAEAKEVVDGLIRDAFQEERRVPTMTSFRDDSPNRPSNIPPAHQPDNRIVPAWAAGTAVAGIGVGAACVGVGCGFWLACRAVADVTLMSVLFVTLPIAAVAAVVAAVATAISRFRAVAAARPEHHHHYKGDVHQDNSTHNSKNTGVVAYNRNDN